jgi:hypothetical protein
MSKRTVKKLTFHETDQTITVKDPSEKISKTISLKTSPQVRQRGKVYPDLAPDDPGPVKPRKPGIMLRAYCTNKECKILKFHEIVKAGTLCKCGYPLSWLGPAQKERNKYADGPVNSGSADRW